MDKKIRVVKRADAAAAKVVKRKVVTRRASARAMVSNVTEWVVDLKARKSEETKAAIEMLFAANHQPNES
ncbi:MAG: hypothetical protein WKF34_09335 [Pyrinomonadaceae bacterium]